MGASSILQPSAFTEAQDHKQQLSPHKTTIMTKTARRRYCRIDGCSKIVKSQGLCQGHGAKTRLCKIDGCQKQAQGNFDGMCKVSLEI